MGWLITVIYFFFGVLWAEFLLNNKRDMDYHTYVYHALFWPISAIGFWIGGKK